MNTILKILLNNRPQGTVKRVVVGINWTLVEGEQGCGLAQTPRRDTPGCKPISKAGELCEMDLNYLTKLIKADNPMEVAIGMAAINAYYNRYDLVTEPGNGLDVFCGKTDSVTTIGRFPGLERRYKSLKVIEKEPNKGEFPESMAKEILETSSHTIITASTFVNGTAFQMLSYAPSSEIAFVGPGTPLCPRLFELGIHVLSGLIITNPSGASRIVSEGGAVKELKKVGRYATIRRG